MNFFFAPDFLKNRKAKISTILNYAKLFLKFFIEGNARVSDGSGSPQRSEDYSGQRDGGSDEKASRIRPMPPARPKTNTIYCMCFINRLYLPS